MVDSIGNSQAALPMPGTGVLSSQNKGHEALQRLIENQLNQVLNQINDTKHAHAAGGAHGSTGGGAIGGGGGGGK